MKTQNIVDYLHAKKVWKFVKIKDMGEYNDLYVRSDVAHLVMFLKILDQYV